MARIPKHIEDEIVEKLSIEDALRDIGCELSKQGVNLTCHNPFREDRHVGSFVINPRDNYAKDFATGETFSPIDILMKGHNLDYGQALRYAAAMVRVTIDDNEPLPKVNLICTPRVPPPPLPTKLYDISLAKMYDRDQEKNPLLWYLTHSVPMAKEDLERMCMAMLLYHVGTSTAPDTYGWTIWWQIDEKEQIHTGKFMKYKADGHRDHDSKYSFNWMHSTMVRAGLLSLQEYKIETCLFGLHLLKVAGEKTEICIVESEKSALICAAFTRVESDRIWMATSGKSNLSREKLQPIIDRHLPIVVYPDYDGYEEWTARAEEIRKTYPYITVSQLVKEQHTEEDGPKADIADIMLRLARVQNAEPPRGETQAERIARMLGAPDKAEHIDSLISNLNLVEQ